MQYGVSVWPVYFVLFVVLVLEKHGVDAMSKLLAPGGEPLWHMASGPLIIVSVLNPTKKCRNRRLPGMTQGDDSPVTPIRFTPARELRTAGSFSGAACSCPVRAGPVSRRTLLGPRATCQSGSPPGAGERKRRLLDSHALSGTRTTTRTRTRTERTLILECFFN